MKKFLLGLVIAAAITGVVSADPAILGDRYTLSAVPTTSTEARYSAGIFGSYVDDFIGVNDYDPDVKNFFFLGGFPAVDGGPVDDTSVLTDSDAPSKLSIGFGKAIGASTLGVYFGGSLFSSSGTDNGLEDELRIETATTTWDSNIAVLFGSPSLGALRLDLLLHATDTSKTVDEKLQSSTGESTTTAISWGKAINENLKAHATLGIVWPDYTGTNLDEPEGTDKNETYTGGGFALTGGVSAGDLSADLTFQFGFADKTIVGSTESTTAGPFWTFIDLGYAKTIEASDTFAIGFKPNASIGLRIWDKDKTEPAYDAPAETTFEVLTGIDVGLRLKLKKSFTLYTGASLQIFDWYVWGVSGGDANAGGGGGSFTGLQFDHAKWGSTGSNLGFGLVYAPNGNLSVGAGLNALLDRFVTIDLQNMQVSTGNPCHSGTGDDHTVLSAAGNVFANMTFDLTVSYKL
jgi:hypothetical protein